MLISFYNIFTLHCSVNGFILHSFLLNFEIEKQHENNQCSRKREVDEEKERNCNRMCVCVVAFWFLFISFCVMCNM